MHNQPADGFRTPLAGAAYFIVAMYVNARSLLISTTCFDDTLVFSVVHTCLQTQDTRRADGEMQLAHVAHEYSLLGMYQVLYYC